MLSATKGKDNFISRLTSLRENDVTVIVANRKSAAGSTGPVYPDDSLVTQPFN